MLSTIALVVAGLPTGNKIGLAAVAAAFIVFALVSSFVIPRRSPNFPGRGIGWYVVLCVLFFVAMLAAVLLLGKERKAGNEPAARTETQSSPLPGQTTAAPPPTTGTVTTTAAPAAGGDATAGKAVFASAGCSGCHTLKAAGATGNVGPNLDELKPSDAAVRNQVIHGGGAMPAFKGQLSDKQIDDVAAFVSSAAGA